MAYFVPGSFANLQVNGIVKPVGLLEVFQNLGPVVISNTTNNVNTSGNNPWQSFTSSIDGLLVSVYLAVSAGAVNATLNIYSGSGTSGGPLLYTLSNVLFTTNSTTGTITLGTPLPLVAGKTYTIQAYIGGNFSSIKANNTIPSPYVDSSHAGATINNIITIINRNPILFVANSSNPQVSIGTNTPANGSALDIESTTGALLVPRMTTTQKNSLGAPDGSIVFDTTLVAFQFKQGGVWVGL